MPSSDEWRVAAQMDARQPQFAIDVSADIGVLELATSVTVW